jgi:N-acetylglutamate synthase-like GNAT family acetyltransferase
MKITYKVNTILKTEMIIELYKSSGINRPTTDTKRISKMYENSNLVITAWDEEKLVGVSRSLTDACYCCYLSDLAIREEYKHKGIGKKLVRMTKDLVGEQTMLLLLAAPSATEYYPKIGMQKVDNGFIIKRTE